MTTRTLTEVLYLAIGGISEDELPCTLHYELQEASGDGWNEPHYPECALLGAVEVAHPKDPGFTIDLMPLLSDKQIAAIERMLMEHEREEREYAQECAAEARAEMAREAA